MPGKSATLIELGAFGKTVLKLRVVVDQQRMLIVDRDGEQATETGKGLRASRFFTVPHPLYRWKERFATVASAGEARVNGEDAFAIEMTPRDLAPSRLYISKQSFLVLRQDQPHYAGDELQPTPVSIDYADHRIVSGLKLAHVQSATLPGLGSIVLNFDTIWLDKTIDPRVFEPR